MTAADQARFMAHYAKQHQAGAFATPTAKDIEGGAVRIIDLPDGAERTVIAYKVLTRPSKRRDFMGRKIELPPGTRIATDVARTPRAEVPSMEQFDVVSTYVEDAALTDAMRRQRREVMAHQISAAGELFALWGRPGSGHSYPLVERINVSQIDVPLPERLAMQGQREVLAVDGWHDDYPFYSDGSWGAVSLRGFDRDPQWGVKPAEMSKKWLAANPGALDRRCDWTELAPVCPGLVEVAEMIADGAEMERVRLLRMAPKQPYAHLSRHTDITDRFAGVADGNIVRFHLPLVTHPQVSMSVWSLMGEKQDFHLPEFTCWYLDARKPHAVTNASPVNRVHLVVDVVSSDSVRERLAAGVIW